MDSLLAQNFIARWSSSGAAERANYQLFLSELCELLGVARPDPTKPDDADNAYVFERSVTFHHPDGSTSTGRIDLYKRACYVLEAKQGVEKREQEVALSEPGKAKAKSAKRGTAMRGSAAWDEAMLKARGQAEQYARALPASEGRPPLLIVVDVGHSIELYSEFTRTGYGARDALHFVDYARAHWTSLRGLHLDHPPQVYGTASIRHSPMRELLWSESQAEWTHPDEPQAKKAPPPANPPTFTPPPQRQFSDRARPATPAPAPQPSPPFEMPAWITGGLVCIGCRVRTDDWQIATPEKDQCVCKTCFAKGVR